MAGTGNSGGRNKLSAQAHIVKGTFQPSRHADAVAPEPPTGTPESPRELEGLALDEWNRMIGRLKLSGTLSVVDDAALYQYCQLFAETEQHAVSQMNAAASVAILEQNIRGLEGGELVALFQEISKMRKLEASYASQIRSGRMGIRQWLVEFGLTPAARSRVKLPPSKPKSKVESFRDAKAGA